MAKITDTRLAEIKARTGKTITIEHLGRGYYWLCIVHGPGQFEQLSESGCMKEKEVDAFVNGLHIAICGAKLTAAVADEIDYQALYEQKCAEVKALNSNINQMNRLLLTAEEANAQQVQCWRQKLDETERELALAALSGIESARPVAFFDRPAAEYWDAWQHLGGAAAELKSILNGFEDGTATDEDKERLGVSIFNRLRFAVEILTGKNISRGQS